jgi:hypothetical protein
MLLRFAAAREEGHRGMLIAEVNSMPATAHPAAPLFITEGFLPTAMGLQARVPSGPSGRAVYRLRGGGNADTIEES